MQRSSYPDINRQDFDKICSDQFETEFGFSSNFFAELLQDIRPEGPQLDLRIDNYYSLDGIDAGVGDVANGPVYNHDSLNNPNDVGGLLFQNEDALDFIDNNHTGVHQWYRWTIEPNNPVFTQENGGQNFCNQDGSFDRPLSLAPSLDPCRSGWYRALNGPNPDAFPFDRVGVSIQVQQESLPLGEVKEHGCTITGRRITCIEHSSPFLIVEVEIPDGAEALSFEYRFLDIGDGDYAAVFLESRPIWTIAGSSFFGDEFIETGPIPIGSLTGNRKLTIALYGVGEPNAEFEIQNFNVVTANSLSSSAEELRLS